MTNLHKPSARESYTLVWAVLWLLVLAPTFFITYGWSNQLASQLSQVDSFVYSWETIIPLLPWTIVPYWSIDLLYGFAFLIPKTKQSVHTLGKRLLLAQLICITCFIIFPLQFSWDRPALEGFFGHWFDLLMQFDKPFNQAPSLHIVLLVILWETYRKGAPKPWMQWLVHSWFFLIALSVLTTWQHHFIDVITGIWVGCFCLWCIPEESPRNAYRDTALRQRLKLAFCYGVGALLLALVCTQLALFSLTFLILLWISLALALVALAYLLGAPHKLGKDRQGSIRLSHLVLLLPYFIGASINRFLWNRRQPAVHFITPEIAVGYLPANAPPSSVAIIDLCAEIPYRNRTPEQEYQLFALLDLCAPPLAQCYAIAEQIELHLAHGKTVHVYCALGRGRSVFCTAAWLLLSGRVTTVDSVIEFIQQQHPKSVISATGCKQLQRLIDDQPKNKAND